MAIIAASSQRAHSFAQLRRVVPAISGLPEGSLNPGQISAACERLVRDGMLVVAGRTSRNAACVRASDAGLLHLREWLAVSSRGQLRDELVIKVCMAVTTLSMDQSLEIVEAERASTVLALHRLEGFMGGDRAESALLVAGHQAEALRGQLRWLGDVKDRLLSVTQL